MTVAERAPDPIAFTQAMAPPHSGEAEESVLGAVLRSQSAADEVIGPPEGKRTSTFRPTG